MAYEDEQLGMEMDGAVAQHDEALIATLQRLPLFETFSHEQLAWLCGQATVLSLEAGTRLFVEGQQPDAFWVLLEGAWRFTRWINGRETTITESDAPGTWGGYIPWATNIEFITTRVLYTSRFLRIPPPVVEHMLLHGFPLAPHLLAGLSWGIRNFEAVARSASCRLGWRMS
jgi:CRP-like cAMP-binding protein